MKADELEARTHRIDSMGSDKTYRAGEYRSIATDAITALRTAEEELARAKAALVSADVELAAASLLREELARARKALANEAERDAVKVSVKRLTDTDVIDRAARTVARMVYGFGHAERIAEYTSPEFQREHVKVAGYAIHAAIQAALHPAAEKGATHE